MAKGNRSKRTHHIQKNFVSPYVTREDMSKAFKEHSDDLMKQMKTLILGAVKDDCLHLADEPKKLDKEEGLLRFSFNVNDPDFNDDSTYSKNLHFASTKWFLVANKCNVSNSLSLSFHRHDCFAELFFKGSFTLSLLGTIMDISRTENFCFKGENDSKEMVYFVSWNELINSEKGFVDEMGNAVVEVKFSVDAFTETCPVAIEKCFCIKQDSVLLIGGRRVGVNKGLLSTVSSYFNVLFNGNFRERNQSEIIIEDVGLAEFIYLLDVIYDAEDDDCYARITVTNVESLLHVADRFNVQKVMKQCEEFLKNADMEMEKKLVLSQNYLLSNLQESCCKHYKSMAKLKKLRLTDQFQLLTDETKIKLLETISENS